MRFVKKLIYGLFYLGVLGAIGYGLYASNIFVAPTCFDNRQNQGETEVDCGGPNCIPCALKHIQPIKGSATTLPIGGNTNAVLFFSNPNLNYGAASFEYTLSFYGSGHQKIYSLTRTSYIYPAAAQRVVVEPNLTVDFAKIVEPPELIVASPDWQPAATFQAPRVQLRQIQTQVSGTVATITGVLANRESFAVAETTVSAVISRKTDRVPLGVSKTVLQNLQPFAELQFKITAPINKALKLTDLDVMLFTEAKR